ncbi:MAG: acyl carrier protein [Paracoccaceae bacterium]
MENGLFHRVQKALIGVLGEQARHKITPKATMESVEEWDSLLFVQVMLAIEREFSIKISADDAIELTSVQGILKLIGDNT